MEWVPLRCSSPPLFALHGGQQSVMHHALPVIILRPQRWRRHRHLSRPTACALARQPRANGFCPPARRGTSASTVSNIQVPTRMRLECQLRAGGPGSVLQPGCGCFKGACHMSFLVIGNIVSTRLLQPTGPAGGVDGFPTSMQCLIKYESANRRAIVGFERAKRIRHGSCHSLPFCTPRQQPDGR